MATADSSSSGKAPSIPSTGFIHSLSLSTTDTRIARLNKILATSSGVDTTLTLVGYSLFFVSSQLGNLQTLDLQRFAKRFADNASKQLRPGEGLVATMQAPPSLVRIADLQTSTKTLAGMCSDFRAFTRLWGLLGVWSSARKTYLDPPKDSVVHAVSWAQSVALGAYLIYENGYYLAGKGVLKGWSPEKQKKWAKISLRMFLAYVVVEWVRLFRTRQLREEKKASYGAKHEEIKREEEIWWRSAKVDAAYTPLTMHWASENGMLSDGWVGALMTMVGFVKFRAAWAQTA